MLEELNQDNLKEIIKANQKVIVQYGASWCGVCKIVKPKFTNLAKENEGVKFIYVDAEKYPESRQLADVNNLPTFASFLDGKLVKQAMGSGEGVIAGVLNEITSN